MVQEFLLQFVFCCRIVLAAPVGKDNISTTVKTELRRSEV